ncbi:hypothetical protein CDL15_Pgr024096 [Punica granatum]|uniref:Uncharacterized protein n=1 Tax=Punica granatum TaxID=22663 RepID=A0A218XX44_PUNGR|nr:hypothetical protein CDL15_Pgr024096 [Punica granatum]PKI61958.1 hypothetical protein CRG98_017684 [Punica granatum]
MDPCPQTNPQFPCYYSPPTWGIPWLPSDPSSLSNKVSTWVIVGSVAAALIFLALVYIFLEKWAGHKDEEKAKEPPPVASGSSIKPPKESKTLAKKEPVPSANEFMLHLYLHPHMSAPRGPGNCSSCRRRAGLYQLSYRVLSAFTSTKLGYIFSIHRNISRKWEMLLEEWLVALF